MDITIQAILTTIGRNMQETVDVIVRIDRYYNLMQTLPVQHVRYALVSCNISDEVKNLVQNHLNNIHNYRVIDRTINAKLQGYKTS